MPAGVPKVVSVKLSVVSFKFVLSIVLVGEVGPVNVATAAPYSATAAARQRPVPLPTASPDPPRVARRAKGHTVTAADRATATAAATAAATAPAAPAAATAAAGTASTAALATPTLPFPPARPKAGKGRAVAKGVADRKVIVGKPVFQAV